MWSNMYSYAQRSQVKSLIQVDVMKVKGKATWDTTARESKFFSREKGAGKNKERKLKRLGKDHPSLPVGHKK